MSNLKMTNLDGTSDHHLNMLHRIHLDEKISKLKEEHQKVLNEEKLKNVQESPSTKEESAKQKKQIEDLNKQLLKVKKERG